MDLQDELAELRVDTWGGNGDCELHIAYQALPYYDDWGWIEDGWLIEETGEIRAGRLEDKRSQTILTIKEMMRRATV